MFEDKPLWKSKTFWLNLLGTAATVSATLADVLPPQYSLLLMGVANILNRLVTKQPVTLL